MFSMREEVFGIGPKLVFVCVRVSAEEEHVITKMSSYFVLDEESCLAQS